MEHLLRLVKAERIQWKNMPWTERLYKIQRLSIFQKNSSSIFEEQDTKNFCRLLFIRRWRSVKMGITTFVSASELIRKGSTGSPAHESQPKWISCDNSKFNVELEQIKQNKLWEF